MYEGSAHLWPRDSAQISSANTCSLFHVSSPVITRERGRGGRGSGEREGGEGGGRGRGEREGGEGGGRGRGERERGRGRGEGEGGEGEGKRERGRGRGRGRGEREGLKSLKSTTCDYITQWNL